MAGGLTYKQKVEELTLHTGCYVTTPLGTNVVRKSTKKDWESYGEILRLVDEAKQWAIGDWLVDGKSHYGDGLYHRAAEITGLSEGTLQQYKWLADRFQICTRVQDLTYAHHREVASIKCEDERREILQKAAFEGWSVQQLREHARKYRGSEPLEMDTPVDHISEVEYREAPYSYVYVEPDAQPVQARWEPPISQSSQSEEPTTPRPHVSHNSGENEWYTPEEYIEAARKVMASIDLDPATSLIANKRVKAKNFYTKEDDGLSKEWSGNVWMNPPYAQPLISQFSEKLTEEFAALRTKQAVVLVNNATDTRWFQLLASYASAVCFPSGRIRFLDPEGNPGAPLQGQSVLYLGAKPRKFIEQFKEFGFTMYV